MSAPILYLGDLAARERHYAGGFWRPETYYALAASHAKAAPDSYAVRHKSLRLTYRQFLDRIDALADELASLGVRAGERVVTWIPNRMECAVVHLACSRGGYVYCPSPDRNHTVADVVALLNRVHATAFFYQRGFGADADKADIAKELDKVSSLRCTFAIDPPGALPSMPFAELRPVDAAKRDPAWIDNDPDRVRYLSFTSGSTGVPKGVMHSDNTLIAMPRALGKDWGFSANTVTYSMSPISHGLGISGWLTSLSVGGEFVLHDLPRDASLIDSMIETGANYLVGVPTHAIDLLNELRAPGAKRLDKVQCFRISGAATPGPVIEGLLHHGIPVQSGYGMTENCAHQYTRPGDSARQIIETCGKVGDGYEVRIFAINDADKLAKPGEVGQVGGKGASLMLGYFADQAATEASFNSDGWFMTGDLGRHDEQGYLHITGRMKDVIIRGGHNINPGRIEDFAMRHGAIERAAVFPIADERLGERICLAVMFRPGQNASAEQILQRMEGAGLTRYEMPEYFISLPEIPVMTNGKIRKPDLIKRVKAGEIVPEPVRRQGA